MTANPYQHLFLRKKRSGVAYLFFDSPERHNFITEEVLTELNDVVGCIESDPEINSVILISGKGDVFCSGASLQRIARFQSESEALELSKLGQSVFNRIRNLDKPTIAAINGMCVGGGLELALSCTYRIATRSTETILGLPEINYGLIPGWGGTQFLPILIGLEKSLEMISLGQLVGHNLALKLGLVDSIVERDNLISESEKLAMESTTSDLQSTLKNRFNPDTQRNAERIFAVWRRSLRLRMKEEQYPASFAALDAIQAGSEYGWNEGCEIEAERFAALSRTETSRNLIDGFFAKELAKQQAAKMAAAVSYPISVNVISADPALSELLKQKRVSVVALEDADLILDGNEEIDSNTATRIDALFRLMKPDAVLAILDSTASIEDLANRTQADPRIFGMQMFEPVSKSIAVEVTPHPHTSKHALAVAAKFAISLNKLPLQVQKTPGRLINRVSSLYFLQAARLAESGVAIELIEQAARHFGMPVPPFAVLDVIGLRKAYAIANHLCSTLGERFAAPSALGDVLNVGRQKELNTGQEDEACMGLEGRSSGEGFYLWQDGKRTRINPKVEFHLNYTRTNTRSTDLSELRRIADALILPMVDEASRCLDEKIVRRPREIDLAMNLGIGFPPFRGGLLKYADKCGPGNVIRQLDEIYQQTSPATAVSDYLMRLQEQNRKFYSKE